MCAFIFNKSYNRNKLRLVVPAAVNCAVVGYCKNVVAVVIVLLNNLFNGKITVRSVCMTVKLRFVGLPLVKVNRSVGVVNDVL